MGADDDYWSEANPKEQTRIIPDCGDCGVYASTYQGITYIHHPFVHIVCTLVLQPWSLYSPNRNGVGSDWLQWRGFLQL